MSKLCVLIRSVLGDGVPMPNTFSKLPILPLSVNQTNLLTVENNLSVTRGNWECYLTFVGCHDHPPSKCAYTEWVLVLLMSDDCIANSSLHRPPRKLLTPRAVLLSWAASSSSLAENHEWPTSPRACLVKKKISDFAIVALSFLFNKYCPIIN